MTREAQFQIYTTEENMAKLREAANAVDQSLSEYGHHLIERHIASLSRTDEPDGLKTDRSAMTILADLHDDLTEQLAEFRSETAEELLYVHSVRSAYLIALWKLLEEDFSVAERRYALQFGAAHAGIEPEVLATDGPPDVQATDGVTTENPVPELSSVVEMLGDDG